jgi:hypothetical protein
MDSNLAALPVYIMGCQSLLCITSPTYASRLWCLFECFMFLAGGGDQVTTITLPAVEAQLQQGRAVWGSVMLSRAQCTLERDRQRLLATMESAEGNLGVFDRRLQLMLRDSVLASTADTSARGRVAFVSAPLRRLQRLAAHRRAHGQMHVDVSRIAV